MNIGARILCVLLRHGGCVGPQFDLRLRLQPLLILNLLPDLLLNIAQVGVGVHHFSLLRAMDSLVLATKCWVLAPVTLLSPCSFPLGTRWRSRFRVVADAGTEVSIPQGEASSAVALRRLPLQLWLDRSLLLSRTWQVLFE